VFAIYRYQANIFNLATEEAEIRKSPVQGQLGQIVWEMLFWKKIHKERDWWSSSRYRL
jgi:hypothetical protein